MNATNATSSPFRKASADHPRKPSSLDPEPPLILRHRKTNKSSRYGDDSEPVSPRFEVTKARPTYQSGSSNKSNREINIGSVGSSLSLGSKFPLNVSDWNEKVQQETRTISTEYPARNLADPPRPAREGFEWVWFPEGYWAERERRESPSKQKRRNWFNISPDHESDISQHSRVEATTKSAPGNDLPQIKISSNSSHGRSSRGSQTLEEKASKTDTPGSKFRRGLQMVSPKHPHFTSPTGDPEGLYCKVKRGIGTRKFQIPQTFLDDSAIASTIALPSMTAVLLEGTSNYFERQQREQTAADRNHLTAVKASAAPQTPVSNDSRHRWGFGLAPWHRKSSQESFLSASSSVHRLLMGRAPAVTPSPEKQCTDLMGIQHEKVEISELGQPTFLPSEARRIVTPPMSEESPSDQRRGFFFHMNAQGEESRSRSDQEGGSVNSNSASPDIRPRHKEAPQDWWAAGNPARLAAAKDLAKKQKTQFELDLPEHLPSSPLCPKNPMHKSKGKGICVYHGRRRSEC